MRSVWTSNTEVKLRVTHDVTKEIVWLSSLYREMEKRPILQVDNVVTRRSALIPEPYRRTKYFFIRKKVFLYVLHILLLFCFGSQHYRFYIFRWHHFINRILEVIFQN